MYKDKLLICIAIILVALLASVENLDRELSAISIKNTVASFSMLALMIYLNVLVLVPKYLFKNKFWRYVLFLMLGILSMVALVILAQLIIPHGEESLTGNNSLPLIIVVILSTIIKLGFIITGSTVFMLFQQWVKHNQRISALENATMQSELEQLKNQINPHFLFNMLNNANELTQENPKEASKLIFKLNDLLKYQLNDSTKDNVSLTADIQFLTDFLNLEKIRRDNFEFIVSLEGDLSRINVPPMLFIPFVENAVKHGNNKESYIHLYFKIENNKLNFICTNSKPKKNKLQETKQMTASGGLGLSNIKRRLELLYGEDYSLDISENETTYTVKLYLNL